MFSYPTPEVIAAWGAVIAALGAAAFKVWRSTYKTNLDNNKDRIEGAGLQLILDRLQKQNDELRIERDLHKQEAIVSYTQRMIDAQKIAHLEAENIYLKNRLEEIAREVAELKTIINLRVKPRDDKA